MAFMEWSLDDRARERFFSHVMKTDTCWLWTASVNTFGYGQMAPPRRGLKPERAHRISWMIHYGDIAANLFVCHKCDVPRCVNPEHLFLGTAKDNSGDMMRKSRGVFQRHPEKIARGERQHLSKMTIEKVLKLRRLWGAGATDRDLAKIFSLSESAVRAIALRETWTHIP
jgi:hypothetical protein